MNVVTTGVGVLLAVALVLGLAVLVTAGRLFRKVPQGKALIVSKMRKVDVTFTGTVVLPVLHKAEVMDISVKTIEIGRTGHEGLICRDNIRADIRISFFVRVNKTADDVVKVAQAIGTGRASDRETLQELFNAKFSEALKTVGKQLDFADLYTKRDEFRDRIIAARFHVPDMLANRADIRNLGEVLTGREELFALSHVENALTAHPYAPAELQQILAVLRRLLQIRRTLLTVNAAYIASAAQDDAARSEPPFALQGSYRDTVRLAARIEPVMNDAEIEALLDDHYRAEARTLTSGAEANLLRLAELRGRLTADEARRWAQIKHAYKAQPAPSGG